MSVQFEVPLIRVRDASSIVGSLVTMTIKHLNDFKVLWREQLRTSADEDHYWDWEQKQRIYLAGGIGIYEGYTIECEQMTQGMMILQVRGYRSQVDPTRPLVYVHSLATAPWNRLSNPDPNGFRAVGIAMLRFARFRSEKLDYGGLVGLHSLPTAETFYRKMGMIDGGSDAQKENLTYKELTAKFPQVQIMEIDEDRRRSAPSQFQAHNIVELFLVFGARKEKLDLQEKIADEFTKQDFIESIANSSFTNIFYESIDYLAKFDLAINRFRNENLEGNFKNGIDLFTSHPACIGFITAIGLTVLGRPGSNHSLEKQNDKWEQVKSDANQMLDRLGTLSDVSLGDFLDFQTLNELIRTKSGRGINFEREFFLQAFKVLIEEKFQVENMTVCWRSL